MEKSKEDGNNNKINNNTAARNSNSHSNSNSNSDNDTNNNLTNELRLVEDGYKIDEAEMNEVKEFLRFKGFLPLSTHLSNPPQ